MRIIDLLETPISDLELVGDFNKSHSFRQEQDRRLLMNPKAIQKIKDKWANTPVDFNMYFINMPGMGKHAELGEVTHEWLEQNMPQVLPHIKISDDAINILYTNNRGAERVPMTAWVIAHRLGHALSRYGSYHGGTSQRQVPEFTDARSAIMQTTAEILQDAYGEQHVYNNEREVSNAFFYGGNSERPRNYENLMKWFYQAIGTFRSARTGQIRNEFEFMLELLAQYITTGTVRFNPLPKSFGHGRVAWGRQNQKYLRSEEETYNLRLQNLARDLQDHYFPDMLYAAVGRIFVM